MRSQNIRTTLKIGLLFVLLLSVSASAIAIDKVISNSADWKDVYSSMLYASIIKKEPGLFLTSARHGTLLPQYALSEDQEIFITTSRSQPHVVNYRTTLASMGFSNVEEINPSNINLELAKKLAKENNIKKFIIVDDAYGYNALSAASYAVVDNYYVVFANERNIGQIDSFLDDVSPDSVIILGQVDEEVKTRLQQYDPEVINTGDRFDNNIEMVKRYQKAKPSKQILMSNGEFIESSIISGEDPVLFIGRSVVPTQVQEYIKESDFQVAVLVGNELINSATAIRRQLGISVFVKFAQGARTTGGPIASVEDLDKFPMPRYALDLEIYSILYNRATNSLWVTYRNKAGVGTFLKGTITVTATGEVKVVGDQELVFIDKNQYKTLTYDLSLQDDQNISAKVYTLFGEGKRSLENVLEGQLEVQSVEILDSALINITDVAYDKKAGEFRITIENIGTVDTYINVELLDIYINGEYLTISSDGIVLLKPGKKITISVAAQLSDTDIENNPLVKVKAYYGERENSLIKSKYGEYPFKLVTFDVVTISLIVLIIILLLLILFGRKKCPHCGTKNPRYKKTCKKCGQSLYKHKKHSETSIPPSN